MKALFITIAAATLLGCASAGPAPGTDEAAPVAGTTASGEDQKAQFGNQAAIATIPAAAEDEPGYWEEMICKNEGVTGSRQMRRRCHTRYEWARMESAATETMRDIESQPRGYRD